jgi:pimeloyl-ACP methyl ester carboxylesterase
MNTLFANSPDSVKIAYDRNGTGERTIVLIHGGGSNRQDWHNFDYVGRLQKDFTVIALDLRGHGESGLPTDPADYTIDKMGQDILSVADACEVESFVVWGFSYGGKIGRYLATQSERIAKLAMMSTPMGRSVPDELREEIEGFCERWPPILQAKNDGTLNLDSLSQNDREFLNNFNIPVMMAWGQAMIEWPTIEPVNFLCPVLWLAGSEDKPVMDSVMEYKQSLKGSKVQLHVVEGLNHEQIFEEIDKVFASMLAFTQS